MWAGQIITVTGYIFISVTLLFIFATLIRAISREIKSLAGSKQKRKVVEYVAIIGFCIAAFIVLKVAFPDFTANLSSWIVGRPSITLGDNASFQWIRPPTLQFTDNATLPEVLK